MPLASGTRLGAYEVLSAIGAGGMGEVYKARDTKLHRDVAIKVLPDLVAADSDRLARFEREAQVLAALNHPNIAQVYGLEDSSSVRALVMELVDGQTLSEVLAAERGRGMPLARAWPLAAQIADGLAAAHERGIVHRDLKPANVIVRSDGTVKLLDFGLAKAFWPASTDAMNSPTVGDATEAGLVLGTAAYMSPEQARGRPVDRRSDIWAFGAVLYEMLTGQSCFGRETVSDTIAAVLTSDPDLTRVPAPARRLLTLCLEKDPKKRLSDIGDARFLVGGSNSEAGSEAASKAWIPWTIAGVVAAAALGLTATLLRPQPADRPLVRFDLDPQGEIPASAFGGLAFSPDGSRIVVPVKGPDGHTVLAVRQVDQPDTTVLQGTEGADQPFFSPDGERVAFFAAGKLKSVPIQGGAPAIIADVRSPRGGWWGQDGAIIVALINTSGLWRVTQDGGPPQPLTTLQEGELTHRWPQVLPGNTAVLFTAHSGSLNSYEDATIAVQPLPGGTRKTLWRGGYYGRFIPTDGKRGHLVFIQRGVLYAARFDANQLVLEGTPVPILQNVAADSASGAGRFDWAMAGMFAFRHGTGVEAWSIAWLDSSSKMQPLLSKPVAYYSPRLSPDGRKLAVGIDNGKRMDLFIHDFERDTTSPLTFSGETNTDAIWAPDAAHLAFRSRSSGAFALWWIRADGAGSPQPLASGQIEDLSANALSPKGDRLIYAQSDPATDSDIWVIPIDVSDPDHPKAGPAEPFLRTPASETRPAFSHDGRWVAYTSNDTGVMEVYVRPFILPASENGSKWRISTTGGFFPIWSRNGRELFYLSPENRIMVSDFVVRNNSFVASKARLWSSQQLLSVGYTNLDLAPDGKRFAILPAPATRANVRLTVLLNFFDELRRRVP
jgi:Tol biopolymer transport system component/tRNA A-37 threonylcarbamoyl transferase component Bud32